jgi:3-hydroxyacyl-CoA dehydrogenase/enoyl-CoA hydratase/3-hydroxybutyryl-CoA epimerase
MHFYNPVPKMPLVEIVRGARTDARTIATTAALALKLGKTPVVTADCAGFVVNRLLGPYLDEALRQFAGGVDPARVDRVAVQFGMPMGPLRLLDEVGFDIATHAAASLLEAYGGRMSPSAALEPFVHAGRLGKKTGKGFYVHPAEGADRKEKPALADDLDRFVAQKRTAVAELDDAALADRMLLAMLNEAAWAMSEDVVASPSELDLATVFGMGFPPFRGGLLRWADTLGAAEVVARIDAVHESQEVRERPDGEERWRPAPILVEMAASGRRWYD